MADTKELILLTALRLFARDGYEAVSVSMIASALGMVKSALYKHYKNKRDILDSIIKRMQEMDAEEARAHDVPEDAYNEAKESYEETKIDDIAAFTEAMFDHWTTQEFSSLFRKMLTIEQYRNEEIRGLYEQYLSSGVLSYLEDLFAELTGDRDGAKDLALQFYAPMYMLYNLYDTSEDKRAVKEMLHRHVTSYIDKMKECYPL